MVGYSKQKPLWADEVVYRWIAILPTTREIWLALTLGLNPDPPLAHLLVHWLTVLFGSSPLVVRLASIGGITMMLVGLFFTLRRYVGPFYALLGLLLPFCTTLVDYGYEARPYGLMYGCFGIAIYCWVRAGDDGSSPIAWNVGLGLALAAALSCHFYAVFALPAFYMSEYVRTLRRRVSWPTVSALVGASATMALYWPIIVGARKYSNAYFGTPRLLSLPSMADSSLRDIGIVLVSALFLLAVLITLGIRFTRKVDSEEMPSMREIAALGLGFLFVPLLAFAAGVLFLKAFTDRYALHGLFGVFLLFPLFASRVCKSNRSLGLVLLVSCGIPGLMYVTRGIHQALKAPDPLVAASNGGARPIDLFDLERTIPQLNGDIVVSDPHLFLQMVNYSPTLKARCIYLWDAEKEREFAGHDDFANFVADSRQMGWFRAEQWGHYRGHEQTFLFLTTPDGQSDGAGWLRAYLEAVDRYGDVMVKVGQYLVVTAKPRKDEAARLRKILNTETGSAKLIKCHAVHAMIVEADGMFTYAGNEAVRDVAFIAGAQRIEHHEIAAYGAVRLYSTALSVPRPSATTSEGYRGSSHAVWPEDDIAVLTLSGQTVEATASAQHCVPPLSV